MRFPLMVKTLTKTLPFAVTQVFAATKIFTLNTTFTLAMILAGAMAGVLAGALVMSIFAEKAMAKNGVGSGAVAALSFASQTCTPKENWQFGAGVPAAIRKEFKAELNTPASLAQAVKIAGFRFKTPVAEAQTLAEYFVYRRLYQLELFHLARRGFSSIVFRADRPEIRGIKLAALECLERLRDKSHSMNIVAPAGANMSFAEVVRSLSSDVHLSTRLDPLWAATISILISEQGGAQASSSQASSSQASELLALLQKSGAWYTLAQVFSVIPQGDDRAIIRNAEALLSKLAGARAYSDLLYLTLGRAYYDTQQYKKAIEILQKVDSKSFYFVDALSTLAWANLQVGAYAEAAAKAHNFITGPVLRKTFSPEMYLVLGIAFHETCNYPEAFDVVRRYKKIFGVAFRWLKYLNRQKLANEPDQADKTGKLGKPGKPAFSYYDQAVKFVKDESKVPSIIASEWLRSPAFESLQREINLIYEERRNAADLQKQLPSIVATNAKAKTWISSMLKAAQETVAEENAVAGIERELTQRMREMVTSLNFSTINIKLLEAELYNILGEKVVNKEKDSGSTDAKKLASDSKGGWDWGRVSSDTSEVWIDEVGLLQTEIKDKCKH